MKQISVIIPTYNRASFIESAVRSVLEQEGQEEYFRINEVVVVDDASKDDTENVLGAIEDKRIRYHKLSRNGGAGHARNTGATLVQSEWIAFQDSDDIWMSDKLKKQVQYLDGHPECAMVTHSIKAVFTGGREIITRLPDREDQLSVLLDHNFADTPTMLIRKKSFMDNDGFDESLKALEDWDFALRYVINDPIGVINEPLLRADMTVEGVSSNMANYYEARCRMIAKNKAVLLDRGLFNAAVKKLLLHAMEDNVLEQVGKMLELSLVN